MLQLLVAVIEHGYEIDFSESELIPLLFDLLDGKKDYLKEQSNKQGAANPTEQQNDEDKKDAAKDDTEHTKSAEKHEDGKDLADDKLKDEQEDPTVFKNGGRYTYNKQYDFYYEIKR